MFWLVLHVVEPLISSRNHEDEGCNSDPRCDSRSTTSSSSSRCSVSPCTTEEPVSNNTDTCTDESDFGEDADHNVGDTSAPSAEPATTCPIQDSEAEDLYSHITPPPLLEETLRPVARNCNMVAERGSSELSHHYRRSIQTPAVLTPSSVLNKSLVLPAPFRTSWLSSSQLSHSLPYTTLPSSLEPNTTSQGMSYQHTLYIYCFLARLAIRNHWQQPPSHTGKAYGFLLSTAPPSLSTI